MNVARPALTVARRSALAAASSSALLPRSCARQWRSFASSSARSQAVVEANDSGTPSAGSPSNASRPEAPAAASQAARSPPTSTSASTPEKKFVPPPIPTTVEELRYFQLPESPPLTHGIHIATLTLQTYGPTLHNLENFCTFALRVMGALGIPHSGVARLPTQKSLWTVPKSPFVHKKAQENFERRTHRRAIKMWDANPAVVDRCLAFLREHALAEVEMKAQLFRYVDLPKDVSAEQKGPPSASETPAAEATPRAEVGASSGSA